MRVNFVSIIFTHLLSCFSLQWTTPGSTTIQNGGDIVTYGSFPTLAQGNGRNVKIYYQEYSGTTPYWSYGATLVANLTNEQGHSELVNLGSALSAGKGLLPLDILFASAPQNNSVFVFQDTRLHWTQQQILKSPDSQRNDSFGYDVALNVLNPNRAVISAPFDDDNGPVSGSAYVFLSNPTGTSWTLTQKLRSDYISPYARFGEEVTIFDNKIAITAPGDCKVYLYSEEASHEGPFWTQQQVLWYSGCGGSLTISQYDDNLVVGNPTYTNPTTAPTTQSSGMVYILDSKTYRGECGGDFMPRDINEIDPRNLLSFDELVQMKDVSSKGSIHELDPPNICETTRWSQTQSLTLSNNLCGYFGSNVAIFEDVLVAARLSTSNSCPLTGAGNPTFLVYERNPETNSWTLSDTITGANTYASSGAGSNGLSLYGTSFVVGTKNNFNRVYSYTPSSTSIGCVYLEFADTFGDGWSGVDLLITNTEDYTERYSFYCDAVSNPRKMRYCPSNVNNYEGNSFKMEIMNPKPHPYHDEIRWTVTPEGTGIKTYGDMNTKFEFHFDGTEMILYRSENLVEQYNYDCNSGCKPIFEASSDKMVVLPITLYDSGGNSWQNTYNYGTSYVITDRRGKRVYAKGTLCDSTTRQTCYIELPYDEKFAIRVDGALDSQGGQHTWSFCGITGSNVDHVAFITSSSSTQACWVEEDYTQGTYCQSVLHSVPLQGMIILHGFHTLHNLSKWDELALSASLEKVFHSHAPLYTSFTYTSDSALHGLKVTFITYIPVESFGLDGLDPDNLHVAYEKAASLLSSGVTSGLFVNSIDQYLSEHQHDGHHYDLYDHGFVELLSVHEERSWKNYIPLTYAPSPIPTQQFTQIPTSLATTNKSGPTVLSGHMKSTSPNANDSPFTSVPFIMLTFVALGAVLIVYLNRSSKISPSSSRRKGGKKIQSNDTKSQTYRELSTSSVHKSDPLYDDEDDDDDEEDEDEEDDIEAVSFTECVGDHNDDNSLDKENKKQLLKNSKKKSTNHHQTNTKARNPIPKSSNESIITKKTKALR